MTSTMDRKELQDLSKVRLKEANALLELGLADGHFTWLATQLSAVSRLASPKPRGEGSFQTGGERNPATPITLRNWSRLRAWTKRAFNRLK